MIIYLFENQRIINWVIKSNPQLHSENFIVNLKEVLAGNWLSAIESVYFVSGPGGQTGERVSLAFTQTLVSLNSNLKVFTIDSLSFQKGLLKNCLSIVSVGNNSKSYYLNVYDNSLVIENHQRIKFEELEEIKKKFVNYQILEDFRQLTETMFFGNFLSIKDRFQELKKVLKWL